MAHAPSRSDASTAQQRRVDPLASGVAAFLREHGLTLCGSRVLALCSGGVDSVSLVDVLAALPRGSRPRSVEVLFLDHGLRDCGPDREAARAVAARHGLQWHERTLGLAPGGNLQARARDARYGAAAACARERGCDVVATGHTADDQLETMLYGMVASSGAAALAGLLPGRALASGVRLVRPLLATSRARLAARAAADGLRWADDPSNARRDFRRNAIRHDVVPPLLAVHPGAGANLERTRAALADMVATGEDLSRAVLATASDDSGALDVRVLQSLGTGARHAVVATWLRSRGVGRAVTARVVRDVAALVEAPHAATGTSRPGPFVRVRGGCVRCDGYHVRFTNSVPQEGEA